MNIAPNWVYAVIAFVALNVVVMVYHRIRIRRIAASRPGENFDTFHSSFAADDISAEILHAVYAEFQKWVSGVVAFPVRATDNIGRIYGMDEDLDDAIVEVLAKLGRELPPDEEIRKMPPVITVRDFVLIVAACPVRRDAEFYAGTNDIA